MKSSQEKNKLPKAKVFHIILMNLVNLGVRPNVSTQVLYPLNRRICMGFLALGCCNYCTFVFIIYDARTFVEYVKSTYTGSFGILINVAFLFIMHKIERLFDFVDSFDSLVHTSE